MHYLMHMFKICNILKFVEIAIVECCVFVNNCFNKYSFSISTKHFKLASATHLYNTRSVRNYLYLVITLSDSTANHLSTQPL